MNIAEKISYLREKEGWSQYELAGRLNVPQQQISEWESGDLVPDAEKIVAMSEMFGVTTDYMLKSNDFQVAEERTAEASAEAGMDRPESVRQPVHGKNIQKEADIYDRFLTGDEAKEYIDSMIGSGKKIALGVFLCIISPVVLIQLSEIGERGRLLTENAAGAIGLVFLFACIAIAVAVFIPTAMKIRKYEDFEIDLIHMTAEDEKEIRGLKGMYEDSHRRDITVGVVMCIVSVIPLVVAGAFDASDIILVSSVSFLLIVVALAVYKLIKTSMVYGGFQKILQEGDYTARKKVANSSTRVFQKVYWSVMVAAYLIISFLTGRWDITWIIWPVAGVLFGGIYIILNSVIRIKR